MTDFVPLPATPAFDPRKVAVQAWDVHLPPVPVARLQADFLHERFLRPPVWQPELREEPRRTERPARAAAVLIAVVMRADPAVLLTVRADHLPTHSGQIAFPGGKVDAGESFEQAALREAREEVGLLQGVDILGALPPYVTGTDFHIVPMLGLVEPGLTLTPHPGEVAEVFEVPLRFLMNPAHHARHVLEFQGRRRTWFSMPWHDPETGRERYIWGATAGMLRNLYRLLIA